MTIHFTCVVFLVVTAAHTLRNEQETRNCVQLHETALNFLFIVGFSRVSIETRKMYKKVAISSATFCFDIETFLFIAFAHGGVIRKHCYVSPIIGIPVRIVISFLGAFITTSCSIWILTGVNSRLSI